MKLARELYFRFIYPFAHRHLSYNGIKSSPIIFQFSFRLLICFRKIVSSLIGPFESLHFFAFRFAERAPIAVLANGRIRIFSRAMYALWAQMAMRATFSRSFLGAFCKEKKELKGFECILGYLLSNSLSKAG